MSVVGSDLNSGNNRRVDHSYEERKDVLRHEKLQVLYWLKTKTVDSVLSAAVRRTGNIVLQYKDGCLVIEKGE
jgi:hypothetical protein